MELLEPVDDDHVGDMAEVASVRWRWPSIGWGPRACSSPAPGSRGRLEADRDEPPAGGFRAMLDACMDDWRAGIRVAVQRLADAGVPSRR